MLRNKVLLIEDDAGLAVPLKDYFEDHGLCVLWADTGAKGEALYKESNPDIVLLDVILPDHNGFEILEIIREKDSDTPIVLMTGTEYNPVNQVRAYKAGSINFMPKPIVPQAMLALIQHVLRLSTDIRKYNLAGNEIIVHSQAISINGSRYIMREKDYALLLFLVERKGQVVRRQKLLKQFWKEDAYDNNKLLDGAIYRLRKILSCVPEVKIDTVYATGYMLHVD